jgi:hypothetical protein
MRLVATNAAAYQAEKNGLVVDLERFELSTS